MAQLFGTVIAVLALALSAAPAVGQEGSVVSHALVEFGEPRYGADFTHFDYADPAAQRGGTLSLASPGSFDTVNAVPLGGEFPRSISLLFDTLMVPSQDELSAFYPLIAESVEYAADRSWLIFTLRPEARWHDGEPITADDVAWTFEMIREHGRPFLRQFYAAVESVSVVDDRRVRFDFATRNTMKPLVRLATLTVQPRHWWTAEGRDISRSTLEPILGSGPYRLASVDQGRALRYERVEDYWADDLPVRVGHFNPDVVTYRYYRDPDVMFEAFKASAYDFRYEFTSRIWATGYNLDTVERGLIQREVLPVIGFRGMQGFFLNLRLPQFADRDVRRALSHLYPFEWVQERIMHGLYERIDSYFQGSDDWSARGLPEGQELALLEPYRGALPPELFEEAFVNPVNDLRGVTRANARRALEIFAEAGWEIVNGRLTNRETGRIMAFEILLRSPSLEPHTQPFVRALEQVGIEASIRWVDSAEFLRRYQNREFEAISFAYTFYPPPGTDLASYFGSAEADDPGSANIMGIQDPVVDAMIETVVAAEDLETLQAATRALDRVLLWGHYVVPHWHNPEAWIAYWDRFGRPETEPPYTFAFPNGIGFQPTWWIDPERDAALAAAR